MAQPHCPTCGRTFAPKETPAFPFCSHRCRQIDLGRWLDERYGLPQAPEDDEDADPFADPDERM